MAVLRRLGVLLSASEAPRHDGYLESRERPRRIVLRYLMSPPGDAGGAIVTLYGPPVVVEVTDHHIRLRGFERVEVEPGRVAGVLQEWLVWPGAPATESEPPRSASAPSVARSTPITHA